MKKLFAAISAFALVAVPTTALASTASVRLVLTVPVRCTLDVVGGTIEDNILVLHVHRNCNTGHEVVLSGLSADDLGAISVNYNGDNGAVADGSYTVFQTERYYDQTDSVVIHAENGSAQDMLRLAGSLQLSVNIA